MLEPGEYLYEILSDKLLKSKSIDEYFCIMNTAKPGYTETSVAAMVLLSHSIQKLSTVIENLNDGGNRSNNSGNGKNPIQGHNHTT